MARERLEAIEAELAKRNKVSKPIISPTKKEARHAPPNPFAFARGALDTASFGFAPKVGGAIGANIARTVRPELFENESFGKTYENTRNLIREENALAQEENPWIYGAGNVAGAALPIQRIAKGLQSIPGAAQFGKFTKYIPNSIKAGALYGGLYEAGSNDKGEVGEINAENLKDIGKGAALGGALGGVLQGTGSFVKAGTNLIPGVKNARETKQINKILNEISPSYEGEINTDIRTASKNIINTEKQALQAKAQPYYDKASPQKVKNKELNELFNTYPVIRHTLKQVLKDPVYQPEIKKYGVNSVHTLDIVKKELDNDIRNLHNKASGTQNTNRAGRIIEAKDKLLEKMDEISPNYKQARQIYAEEAPAVKAVQETKLGKFAKYSDEQIKKVGKEIFDRAETNHQRYLNNRDRIYKENPDLWKAVTRQELERKIGSPDAGLTNFFKKGLRDEKSYELLHDALFYNPKAQAQLANLRKAFGKTTENADFAKSISPQWARKIGSDNVVDLILEPKWAPELKEAAEGKISLPELLTKASISNLSNSANNSDRNREEIIGDILKEIETPKQSENDLETKRKRLEAIEKEFKRRQQQSTVSPEVLDKIEQAESGGNPNAKSKTSTASGNFQFTNTTWKEGVKKYGEEEGVKLGDKNKPEAQRKIAERMLSDNSKELEKFIGRKPKAGEIYLTHFLGLGGAKKALRANKQQLAVRLFPKEAAANKSIFYNNGRPITVAMLINKLNNKVI